MDQKEGLTIAAAAWSASIADMLQAAGDCFDEVRAQVERGTSQLFTVERGGAVIAAFVLRIDHIQGGDDGVIVAAAGRGGDVNLTAAMLPFIEQMFIGCKRVRIHTARPGLAKILAARFGYRVDELVLSKEIKR